MDEHSMQVSLLAVLKLKARRDVYWFAVPNAGRRSPRHGAWMRAEGMRSGVADLCFMTTGGQCCWLELKTGKNKMTQDQLDFESICIKLGHPYAAVYSIDQALGVLQEWGLLR
jgi:hypothetical protein